MFVYNTARYLLNMRGELIRTLRERGMKVSAIVPRDDAVPRLEAMGVAVFDWRLSGHGMNPFSEWMSYRELSRLIGQTGADIVFSFTIKPVIYASVAAHRLGCRRVYSMVPGRGYLFGEATALQRLLRTAVAPLYRRAPARNRRVFFQNRDDRDYFVERRFIAAEQAVVIDGSGVDTSRFSPRPGETVAESFLLIARLLKEKGIEDFVDAARRLKARHPAARFMVLGPLSASPSAVAADTIRRWHDEGVIEYLGEADDVRPHLARAMVFVLPSWYGEGLPRTSLEALAMAKPVVTTDWPGCREAVVDGENGFLVPVRNAVALADAMERFLLDPELAGRMGAASRVLAERRFDVRRVNTAVIDEILA
ncbi:MAG: glycosyltransferase family 4 protein [Gammaproteobacteria bacterium]|nr:glycosyltransferase family 4 protein [Gammaproteobacteria bacterium]